MFDSEHWQDPTDAHLAAIEAEQAVGLDPIGVAWIAGDDEDYEWTGRAA